MSDTQNRIEDLEEKIETLEDQLTSVRKVTPLHDITWYVKWISVFFVCCAVLGLVFVVCQVLILGTGGSVQ